MKRHESDRLDADRNPDRGLDTVRRVTSKGAVLNQAWISPHNPVLMTGSDSHPLVQSSISISLNLCLRRHQLRFVDDGEPATANRRDRAGDLAVPQENRMRSLHILLILPTYKMR